MELGKVDQHGPVPVEFTPTDSEDAPRTPVGHAAVSIAQKVDARPKG